MLQERKNGSAVAHGSDGATFEQQFSRLQSVVQRLSDGNLTLQDALSAFEEGMALADSCGSMLEQAELRVQQVSDRATRTGQSAAAALSSAVRAIEPVGEAELLTFEVESYEETLVFEVPQGQAQGKGGERAKGAGKATGAVSEANQAAGKQGTPSTPSTAGTAGQKPPNPNLWPLDPLFDEDD